MQRKTLIIGVSTLILLLLVSSLLVIRMFHQQTPAIEKNYVVKEHSLQKTNVSSKEFKSSVTLSAVGDILIHGIVYNAAKSGEGYDFKPMLANVKSYLEAADITIANQETMVGGIELGLSTYPSFNSPYEVADALQDSGVDIVSIANNHTLDRGEKAILNATAYYNKIGMIYTGAYHSPADREVIRTIKKNGITFSFLPYTYGTNGIPVPKDKPYLVNLIDFNSITEDIKKAKALSDVVVVSMHFGNEYERLPNNNQKEIANQLVNLGADIILGHHPHVLQPMEWIETENGNKGFVIYSLGNFLSGQKSIYREIGGILTLTVNKEIKNGSTTISVENPTFLPTYVAKKGYKVVPLENAINFGLANSSNVLTEIKQHMSQLLEESKIAQAN